MLHNFLKGKMDEDSGVLSGIDPKRPFEVHSIRPSLRTDWNEQPRLQWVIELTQRIRQYVDPAAEGTARPDYYFRGGCTLLVDAETGQGALQHQEAARRRCAARNASGATCWRKANESLAATYFGDAIERKETSPLRCCTGSR